MLHNACSLKIQYAFFLTLIPLLFQASQQKEKGLSPRTIQRLKEETQSIRDHLTMLKVAYAMEENNHKLIMENPRIWLFNKSKEALKACNFTEQAKRTEYVEEEKRSRMRLQTQIEENYTKLT